MITIEEALKIARKLGLQERRGKEIFFKLVHGGRTILTTAVPKGRGPLLFTNKFRNQLLLNQEQFEGARKCPFQDSHYLAHLTTIGRIPESDD